MKAIDLDNRAIRIKAHGYYARVLQHEVDHLDGILFVDRVEDKSRRSDKKHAKRKANPDLNE